MGENNQKLAAIHALWIGSELSQMTIACLKSFFDHGHIVYLHVYNKIENIPKGIITVDANQIIPAENIIKHRKTGSYALFSDIFRYELLRKTENNVVYVDCDVLCLKPIYVPETGYLFGYEDDEYINGAILALPSDSKLLELLLRAVYDGSFIPPWFSDSRQKKLRFKKLIGIGRKVEDMPWGVLGPSAITYYVNFLGIQGEVQPIDMFYPVHYKNIVGYLTSPELTICDVVTHRTQCIHLYNEMLKGIDLNTISAASILGKLLQKLT